MTSDKTQPANQQDDSDEAVSPTSSQHIPSSTQGFGPDRYDGLDIIEVIQLLRKRLNWETNIDEIVNNEEGKISAGFIQAGKNLRRKMYSLQDDGVFAYAVTKDCGNPIARYNPYDLVCVGAFQTFDSKQMFTVTASAITQVWLILILGIIYIEEERKARVCKVFFSAMHVSCI